MSSGIHSRRDPLVSFVLCAALVAVTPWVLLAQSGPHTYSGWEGQLDVQIPRFDTVATIDGVLDDEVWSRAAVLTGF
ncbi:MAG: hypothetical protein WBW88_06145, partial [Rhodothermales bacterium]